MDADSEPGGGPGAGGADVAPLWAGLWAEMRAILSGRSDTLPRTVNLVQALGNVTVCVTALGVIYLCVIGRFEAIE